MPDRFTRADIHLGNWRLSPFSRYSFQHVAEFVPSALIRGNRLPESPQLTLNQFGNLPITDAENIQHPLQTHLAQSHADALVIMRKGQFIAEWHAPHCDPAKPHLTFSISKSITGLLAGILADQGLLTPDDPVIQHVPETSGSAFADASLRNLFDMETSLDFAEDYLNLTGAYDRYRRATLWNPDRPEDPAPNLTTFLCTIPKGPEPHGHRHAYQSPLAEMAGVVLERVAGKRLPDLISDLLWQPVGAHSDAFITVDRIGTARAAGGLSATARDLARLGELVRLKGAGIVPEAWIDDLWHSGSRETWRIGDQADLFPKGSYRSYWYETGEGELCAIGIHGQWLWIDPANETIVVLMSSLALPTDNPADYAIRNMLRAVCRHG